MRANVPSTTRALTICLTLTGIFTFGCAELEDGGEPGVVEGGGEPGVVEGGEQELLVDHSYPDVLSAETYAKVMDYFTVELPTWRIHNNGCWLKCTDDVEVGLWGYASPTTIISNYSGSLTGSYYGGDGGDFDWGGRTLTFAVERGVTQEAGQPPVGRCFHFYLGAKRTANWPNVNWVAPGFCWNSTTMNWDPVEDAKPLGTLTEIYKKESADFSQTFRFKIRWTKTVMTGKLNPNVSSILDGDDWQHLPVTLWHNPRAVTVSMTYDQGDPDLHTSTVDRPTLNNFECRPYNGAPSASTPVVTETCRHEGFSRLYASVHNYHGTIRSTYTLTITPEF